MKKFGGMSSQGVFLDFFESGGIDGKKTQKGCRLL